MSGDDIRKWLGGGLSVEEVEALLAIAEVEVERLLREEIYPAQVAAIKSKIMPMVEKCLETGDYEKAREILWRAAAADMPPAVNEKVREFVADVLHSRVNPENWGVIEKELLAKVAELKEAGQYDEAIQWLKAYKHIRTYSTKLDEQLKMVEAEVVKLGVAAENVDPILVETGKLVGKAAKIVDMVDNTTNALTTVETSAAVEPDLEAYKDQLKAYEAALVRFNCTKPGAAKIAGDFDRNVAPYLKPLSKAAEYSSTTNRFLLLGTSAVNVRIDGLRDKLIDELKKDVIAKVKSDLEAKVRELVGAGEYAQARETIWTATSTDDLEKNSELRPLGLSLMTKLVNPANWAAIEKEFADKVGEFVGANKYDEAIAWMGDYPFIRTYAEGIDAKLDLVKDELTKIGVDAGKVESVVLETQKAAAEVERLVSHVDTMEKFVTNGDKKLQLKDYEKLLEDYRKALLLNDCTEENANKLVNEFKAKVAPYLELLSGGEEKSELVLGSNAVNDRIRALVHKRIDDVKALKYRWVFDDLIKRVSECVAAGEYGKARDLVRDVALVGDSEWDARIYAVRIGLLNSIVNPNQCVALCAEIDAKAKEFFDAKKYEDFVAYAENYKFVHDTYQRILDALEQTKATMVGLKIAEQPAEIYIDELTARIRKMMEKRQGTYTIDVEQDLTALEKALSALEKSIVEQYYKPDEVKAFCERVKGEILSLLTKSPDPMTTWELNEKLAAKLKSYVDQTPKLIAKRDAAGQAAAYAKLLADIDAEVSFDSQIAMAEDAIAKQLGIKCPAAYLEMNAVLGEYARSMRLLKRGKSLDADQAVAMLVGGVYLEQSGVVKRALELGAKVDAASPRDPLKRSAVLVAIQTGHNAFLKTLADAGAAFSVADAKGDTALHYAVRRGNLAVVKAMLEKNEVDAKNVAGESALFTAVRKNQAAVASALTAAKAATSIKNEKGQTPFDVACLAGSRDVLDVLAEAGAAYGPEHLVIAAKGNRLAVAQWLVGKGVDVNAPDVMKAAFDAALEFGRRGEKWDTYDYLIHEGGVGECVQKTLESERAAAELSAAKGRPESARGDGAVKATGSINFTVTDQK